MIEQILSEAETLLPESHVAILAREVKRLRERPDADALQKLLNEAYRKGNQDAHAARDVCKVILPESVPVAWIVGGIGGDHFTDFEKAKAIAATYGKEPTPLYLHPPKAGGTPPKATSCTGCIGASFDGRFQCAGCTDFSKYERDQPSAVVVEVEKSAWATGGKVTPENSHVAWLRYVYGASGATWLQLCNSDDYKAFKVYRLGLGMVVMDRKERDLLGRLHMVAMQFVIDADPAQRRSAAHLVQAVAALRQYDNRCSLAGAVEA